MHPLITSLDAALEVNYPEFHAALGPGSSQEDLDELERVFGMPLPQLYRDFLAWHGPRPRGFQQAVLSVGNYDITSAQLVIEEVRLMRDLRHAETGWVETAWWGEYYLPLMRHGGPQIVIDMTGEALVKKWGEPQYAGAPGQILEFHHADELRDIHARDLETWIETVAVAAERELFADRSRGTWAELELDQDVFDTLLTEADPEFPVPVSQLLDLSDFE
ncbi:SMI1/KNR4 family protein [Tsukamurella pseudospumae]|uniref:Knr4/Smi1-like domain-containing protein n=1 Tax=Tsukamurella pseudospumae TaxID=239498 RepID=A0A137YYU4_9ACTN|nr:SMI1/KNR4 family protein [Tsukamurella pseudospumae]KXO91110.1 hypothetical protein AXK61_05910 [Tsukamurella pseudospumae]